MPVKNYVCSEYEHEYRLFQVQRGNILRHYKHLLKIKLGLTIWYAVSAKFILPINYHSDIKYTEKIYYGKGPKIVIACSHNNNSIQLFIIYVLSQQPQGQLQT
jgi:hypothetical protein